MVKTFTPSIRHAGRGFEWYYALVEDEKGEIVWMDSVIKNPIRAAKKAAKAARKMEKVERILRP